MQLQYISMKIKCIYRVYGVKSFRINNRFFAMILKGIQRSGLYIRLSPQDLRELIFRLYTGYIDFKIVYRLESMACKVIYVYRQNKETCGKL
jgi:hypothetical protein